MEDRSLKKSLKNEQLRLSRTISYLMADNDAIARRNQRHALDLSEIKFKVNIVEKDNISIEADNTRLKSIFLLKKVEGTV